MTYRDVLLFDDDGRTYLVYGGGRLLELTSDGTAISQMV